MGQKKPRAHLQLEERSRRRPNQLPKPERKPEFYDCAYSGCSNIIAQWAQPNGAFKPVYCVLHAHLTEKN